MPSTASSSPMSAEDMMARSALAVSPLLTSSVFADNVEELSIEENHDRPAYVPPPPSDRWTSRLVRARQDQEMMDEMGPVTHPTQSFPFSAAVSFMQGQNCFNGRAVQLSPLLANTECHAMYMLDFDITFDDGGQYGSLYGIENLLLNDGSVYCSGRKGVVNILTQYVGYLQTGLATDTSCSIKKMVLKAPQHGFTAPCREGLIFMSHKEIDIQATERFDDFDKEDYEEYIRNKTKNGRLLDDQDPVAWFTIEDNRMCIVDLNNRSGKYVLIKMLRSDQESDNIDLQYVGYIGFAGPRSFGSGKLC